ncbi:MAG TPA: hypothetical protein PLZ08_08435 [Bacillota bacterium]|jgi:nitrogen fixation/metabolism regulation signal transduction histidine kinase|nr:hypothetical protein [Bacillota bacterium]HOL09971.1 hypothetical protein [Bacillota bacterium]HPO97970.1 hypothetical protein [Bacillota bacterium]
MTEFQAKVKMMSNLNNLRNDIQKAREIMEEYWQLKQAIDQKYLEACDRVDQLINEYYRLEKV